jgi:uncharacterized repeat protein (TIGR01451 family)/LPXTG-motif cell wall-anchored protein
MKTEKMKNFMKKVFVSMTMLSILIPFGQATKTEAAAARFNFLSGDLELRTAANLTKGDTQRSNPVVGDAGDVFEVSVYYHNGILDTPALDTRVKVNMPTETTNKSAAVSVSIGASNADTITNTVVDGKIVGLSGLNINLSEDAKLEFVAGSARWFPDYTSVGKPAQTLPNSQNGSELFTASGLKLGDIAGCWDHVGYVMFQIKTSKIAPASIIKSKIAKNLTTGTTGTAVSAKAGDVVEYTLTTKNNGGVATDFVVTDDISDVLEYSDIAFVSDGGAVSSNVVTYKSVSLAPGATVSNTFKVRVKNPLPNTPQSGTHFDYTMQNTYGNLVTVNLDRPTPGKAVLNLEKTVRNFTVGDLNFVHDNIALAGDTLEYKLSFSNTGTVSADNVNLSDVLPLNTQYLPGTTLISTNGGIERTFIDGVDTAKGVSLGSIAAGDSGYIKFKVMIASSVAGGSVLKNTGYLKYGTDTLTDKTTTTIQTKTITEKPTDTTLPKTGAESWIITILLVIAAGATFYFLKYKKALRQKIAQF